MKCQLAEANGPGNDIPKLSHTPSMHISRSVCVSVCVFVLEDE